MPRSSGTPHPGQLGTCWAWVTLRSSASKWTTNRNAPDATTSDQSIRPQFSQGVSIMAAKEGGWPDPPAATTRNRRRPHAVRRPEKGFQKNVVQEGYSTSESVPLG